MLALQMQAECFAQRFVQQRAFTRACFAVAAVLVLALSGCDAGQPRRASEKGQITVAAAANLNGVFEEIGKSFTDETGIGVTLSYASTAQLAQQIDNGAPFDVFAAADVEHVNELMRKGKLLAESRAVYARGVLALWIPKDGNLDVKRLEDLVKPAVRTIAIATPNAAPYGQAAIEALRKSSLWERVEGKVVYSTNVNMAKQFAATGNADAAFTAYSLVLNESGRVIRIDDSLYTPLDQAIAVVSASGKGGVARQFVSYVTGSSGRAVLKKFGYVMPSE